MNSFSNDHHNIGPKCGIASPNRAPITSLMLDFLASDRSNEREKRDHLLVFGPAKFASRLLLFRRIRRCVIGKSHNQVESRRQWQPDWVLNPFPRPRRRPVAREKWRIAAVERSPNWPGATFAKVCAKQGSAKSGYHISPRQRPERQWPADCQPLD